MNAFDAYSPAESILIIDPTVPLNALLKYTFLDLVFQQVLKIDYLNVNPSANQVPQIQDIYIRAGKNFGKKAPKAHEIIFIKPFTQSQGIQITIGQLLRLVRESAGRSSSFKRMIRSNHGIDRYFRTDFISRLFSLNRLNEAGMDEQGILQHALAFADRDYKKLARTNFKQAIEIIFKLKGNAMLLRSIDPRIIAEFKKSNNRVDQSLFHNDIDLFDTWYALVLIDDFDSHGHFEHVMDSIDAESTSSDTSWGCSSCSGCGGCGGCGGCS